MQISFQHTGDVYMWYPGDIIDAFLQKLYRTWDVHVISWRYHRYILRKNYSVFSDVLLCRVPILCNQFLSQFSVEWNKTLQICYMPNEDEHVKLWWQLMNFNKYYHAMNFVIFFGCITRTTPILWNQFFSQLPMDLAWFLQSCYIHIEEVYTTFNSYDFFFVYKKYHMLNIDTIPRPLLSKISKL